MKKRLATCVALLMAVAMFAGCSSSQQPAQTTAGQSDTAAASDTSAAETTEETSQAAGDYDMSNAGPVLQRVYDTGVMHVAINAQSPPWRFHQTVDGEDRLEGFEVRMMYGFAEYLSQRLGKTIEVDLQDMTFPGVLAALQADQIDLAPSLAGTEERRENMDFSIPYHRSLQTIIIRKDREDDPIFDPANSMTGVNTGSLLGSSTSVTFQEQYPEAVLTEYEATPDIVLAVANEKVDAGVLNEKYAILICKANPDLMIDYDLAFDIPVERDPGASLATPKGNEDFIALADEWLEGILSDGTFAGYEQAAIEALDDPDLLEGFTTKNLLNN